MKYYFLASGALTPAQLDRLRYGKVTVALTNAPGGWSGHRNGHGFSEDSFSKMLDVLGGRVTKESTLDSFEDRRLVEPKLVFDRTPKPVVISEVQTSKDIEPLLDVMREVLLPQSATDIVLRSAGGTHVDPYNVPFSPYTGSRRRLAPPGFIYLWGTSNSFPKKGIAEAHRLWTVDLPPSTPMVPGPSKNPILDYYNTIVGEVENNVAICLFNLLAENIPVAFAEIAFRYFVEDVAEIWYGTKESKAAHAKLRQSQRHEFFREATVATGLRSLQNSLNQQHARLDRARNEIEDLERKLLLAMAQREGAMRAIDGIGRDLDSKLQSLKDQYDLMRSHQKVEDVIVHSGIIEVKTSMIYCKHGTTGKWHEIGRMIIRIYTDLPKKSDSKSSPSITVENLTHRRNTLREGFHHPHVFPEGNLCMGGYQRPMQEYLMKNDYASLVGLIIFFLETHTPTDAAGRYLDRWPQLSDAEVASLQAKGILPIGTRGVNYG